ncbi:MAG: TetR/AcrR family transcriptional regulator [Thermomicrobiaceae bacterium]
MARVTQQHVDARREAILAAAARLFARKGLSSATMADIASEADLSAGAIYRYFDGKDELTRAVFDEAIARNQRMFDEAAENATTPFDALQRIGRQVWIELEDRDAMICDIQMAVMAAQYPEEIGPDVAQTSQSVRRLLEGMIQAAQHSGEIDPEIDSGDLALLLQAATSGIQMLKLTDPNDLDAESAFKLMVRMVQGLRTPTPESQER